MGSITKLSRRGFDKVRAGLRGASRGFEVLGSPAIAQAQAKAETSFAAVPGQKGVQDVFGAYDVDPNWPQPLSALPGNEKWTWGSGEGVFAENPDRVFILQRGELPNIKRPKEIDLPQLGPSLSVSHRPSAVARRHVGQPSRPARWPEPRNGKCGLALDSIASSA